jgi:hypothetical protein
MSEVPIQSYEPIDVGYFDEWLYNYDKSVLHSTKPASDQSLERLLFRRWDYLVNSVLASTQEVSNIC